jgi:hypothetical protein
MIKIWSYRQKVGPEILLSSRYEELGDSIISLLKYELGYGGVITSITDDHLEVITRIMHCKDRTVFSGEKEEMQYLLTAVHMWLKAEKEVSIDAWYQKVSEVTNGVPLYVVMASGILKGQLVAQKLREQIEAA